MMLIISASHLKVPLPAFTKEKYFSLFFSVLDGINFDVTLFLKASPFTSCKEIHHENGR